MADLSCPIMPVVTTYHMLTAADFASLSLLPADGQASPSAGSRSHALKALCLLQDKHKNSINGSCRCYIPAPTYCGFKVKGPDVCCCPVPDCVQWLSSCNCATSTPFLSVKFQTCFITCAFFARTLAFHTQLPSCWATKNNINLLFTIYINVYICVK